MKKSLVALCVFLVPILSIAKDNWISGDGKVVRDSSGECIRNGVWTPATAHPDCVKDLAPKVLPAPRPVPPPVAQPRVESSRPAPVQQVAPMPSKVVFQAGLLFDFDKSVIKPEGRVALDKLLSNLQSNQAKYDAVIVIGHTDNIGTDAYNMRLGLRRAEAVKAYLVSKGMNANTIRTSSKGESQPVADNKTAKGRELNRRVEVEIVGLIQKR